MIPGGTGHAFAAVAMHCTSAGWPRRPWEVAISRLDDVAADVLTVRFRVDVGQLRGVDADHLEEHGFYGRHELGAFLSGRRPGSAPGPSVAGAYLTQLAAAREVARITHGAHLLAWNLGDTEAALGAFLRNQAIPPRWVAPGVDVRSIAAAAAGSWAADMPALGVLLPPTPPPAALASEHLAWLLGVIDALPLGLRRVVGSPCDDDLTDGDPSSVAIAQAGTVRIPLLPGEAL